MELTLLQSIKEQVAKECGNENWAFMWSSGDGLFAEKVLDTIAIRFSASQNKKLLEIMEDDLKRQMRLNMPGISNNQQEDTWQHFRKTHNI